MGSDAENEYRGSDGKPGDRKKTEKNEGKRRMGGKNVRKQGGDGTKREEEEIE